MAAVGEACKERTKVRDDLEAVAISSPSKRRKVDENFAERSFAPAPPELGSAISSGDSATTAPPPCSGVEKDRVISSTVDLKPKEEECATEIRTVDISRDAQTKSSASNKLSSPEIMESPVASKTTTTTKKPSPMKIPSAAELEEFFAAAEKLEQKRFEEKYNFDISKDVPLEGRYQWIRLKP